jgi:hypothetical protein
VRGGKPRYVERSGLSPRVVRCVDEMYSQSNRLLSTRLEEPMERGADGQMPRADVHNGYSWLAVGVAVGSGLGVATGHVALGVSAGLALGALGAVLAKRSDGNKAEEE